MKSPHEREEKKLRRAGFKLVAGVDEAGRGALAGPIVAAAVILPVNHRLSGIKDSKQLSPEKREYLFKIITKKAIAWSLRQVLPRQIDKKGIQPANRLVLKTAAQKLEIKPDYILIDALELKVGKIPSKSIIRGDEKILCIAAASIIAKVIRDRLMLKKHRQYPRYQFNQHKGYGTKLHYDRIKKYGPSVIHRRSFKLAA
jgi:ribonuclease HII